MRPLCEFLPPARIVPSTLTTARIGEGLDPGDKREKVVPSPPPPLPVVVKLMGCGPTLGGFQFWRRHFSMTLRKCLNLTMPQFCQLEYLQLWGLNELSVKHRGGSWHVESPALQGSYSSLISLPLKLADSRKSTETMPLLCFRTSSGSLWLQHGLRSGVCDIYWVWRKKIYSNTYIFYLISFNFYFKIFFLWSKLCTQHRTGTQDPEIKSCNGPGTEAARCPFNFYFLV